MCVCVCVCVCYFYHPLGAMGSSVFVAFPCHIPFCTLNSEIFARVIFLQNFENAKFRENENIAKWINHSAVY